MRGIAACGPEARRARGARGIVITPTGARMIPVGDATLCR